MEDSRSNVYSTDSEFYYVDGKLKDISEFYKEMKYRGVRSIEPLFNATTNNNIDPIYEMIPKLSIEDNETSRVYVNKKTSIYTNISCGDSLFNLIPEESNSSHQKKYQFGRYKECLTKIRGNV